MVSGWVAGCTAHMCLPPYHVGLRLWQPVSCSQSAAHAILYVPSLPPALTLQHDDGLRGVGVDVSSHCGALVELKLGEGDGAGLEHRTRAVQPAASDGAAWLWLRWRVGVQGRCNVSVPGLMCGLTGCAGDVHTPYRATPRALLTATSSNLNLRSAALLARSSRTSNTAPACACGLFRGVVVRRESGRQAGRQMTL